MEITKQHSFVKMDAASFLALAKIAEEVGAQNKKERLLV